MRRRSQAGTVKNEKNGFHANTCLWFDSAPEMGASFYFTLTHDSVEKPSLQGAEQS